MNLNQRRPTGTHHSQPKHTKGDLECIIEMDGNRMRIEKTANGNTHVEVDIPGECSIVLGTFFPGERRDWNDMAQYYFSQTGHAI